MSRLWKIKFLCSFSLRQQILDKKLGLKLSEILIFSVFFSVAFWKSNKTSIVFCTPGQGACQRGWICGSFWKGEIAWTIHGVILPSSPTISRGNSLPRPSGAVHKDAKTQCPGWEVLWSYKKRGIGCHWHANKTLRRRQSIWCSVRVSTVRRSYLFGRVSTVTVWRCHYMWMSLDSQITLLPFNSCNKISNDKWSLHLSL